MNTLDLKSTIKKETLTQEKKRGQTIFKMLKQAQKTQGNTPIVPREDWLS